MFSSSLSAQPSIERLKGTRGVPGNTSPGIMPSGKVQLVPFLENREHQHAVHGDVVRTRLPEAIDEAMHLSHVEQAMQPEALLTERGAHPRLQVSEHPGRNRHQKTLFRTPNHLL